MPDRIRLTALVANGAMCLVFGFLTLFGLGKGQLGLAFFFFLVTAVAAFNGHVIRKAARLLAEEEWLHAEIRKAELRQRLADLEAAAPPDPPPRLQGPGP